MKYTKEERMDIGRRIYDGELSRYQAAKEYDIGEQTARNYMRMYRDHNGLPAKRGSKRGLSVSKPLAEPVGMEEFESMTKEELIMELMKARIAEARLKKGYEVKGDALRIRPARPASWPRGQAHAPNTVGAEETQSR